MIAVILVTCLFETVLILEGEIGCQSTQRGWFQSRTGLTPVGPFLSVWCCFSSLILFLFLQLKRRVKLEWFHVGTGQKVHQMFLPNHNRSHQEISQTQAQSVRC